MENDAVKEKAVKISDDNFLAALSYISVLCFVPLFKKKNDFVKFHSRQGLMLFIVETALGIIFVIPILGWLVGMAGMLLCFVLSIAGIVNVIKNEKWEIPVIYEWSKKLEL